MLFGLAPVKLGGIALLLAIGAVRCAPYTEPSAAVSIGLSRQTVSLEQTDQGPALKISANITNGSTQLVLVSTCEYALDQYRYALATGRISDDWLEVWRPSCTNENSLAYTPLGPGESTSIPITVIATPALAPRFFGGAGHLSLPVLSVDSGRWRIPAASARANRLGAVHAAGPMT